jgi:hypothetical protein
LVDAKSSLVGSKSSLGGAKSSLGVAEISLGCANVKRDGARAQLGMKPEDVMTKIMANPELAQAFQNPKVQAAIMDCSSNPANIAKYQNDPEIMTVFTKIATIFPGAGMS